MNNSSNVEVEVDFSRARFRPNWMESGIEESKLSENESSQQAMTSEHLDRIADDTEKYLLKFKGRDPLRKWIQYLQWLDEKMPSETNRIISTLKKCLLSLQKSPDYLNDVRYIRLWIRYVRCISKRVIVLFNSSLYCKKWLCRRIWCPIRMTSSSTCIEMGLGIKYRYTMWVGHGCWRVLGNTRMRIKFTWKQSKSE